MSASDKLADILRAIQGSVDELAANSPVPRMGTVTALENGFIYVLIDGMENPTPCNALVSASVGDRVRVEIVSNSARIIGNYTAPPTDDTLARQAEDNARRAGEAADAAQTSADNAATAASDAQTSANNAMASATRANTSAADALTQLSTVQDVVGVVEWAAAHSEQDMATYISSHLSLTDAGLWVTLDDTGYKLLVAATGVSVVDPQGHTVSTYGESVRFDSSRPQYIGGEDAHISYYDSDDDGVPDSIYIGGTNVTIGGKTLSQFAQAIDDATAARRYAEDVPIVTLSSTNGTVFKRNSGVSTTVVATIFTPAGRIDNATELHRRFGAGAYLEWGWRDVVTDAAHVLVLSDPRIIMDGFGLVVSPDDIDTQAVITCSLNY